MPHRIPLRFLDSITRRTGIRRVLLLILAVALLPLAILTTWNGMARLQHDAQEQEQRLAQSAMLTASSELNVIHAAEGVLALLAADSGVRSGRQGRCEGPLNATLSAFPAYSHIALIDAKGRVRCSSHPEAVGGDLSGEPMWLNMSKTGFSVSDPLWGRFSKRQVLWAMLPLTARDGSFDGALSASIDLAWLKRLIASRTIGRDAVVVLVNGEGGVIAASREVSWKYMPISGGEAKLRTARDSRGVLWDYASAPLHIDPPAPQAGGRAGASYHIVFATPQPEVFAAQWWIIASTFALPVLALLLASIAIWIGANRAIIRWIGQLGRLTREIGEGNYRARDNSFANAPDEIRGLAADVHRMARTIAERDRTTGEALDRQRALTMELHHRVRNNLQIIASYLSLQVGRLPEGAQSDGLDKLRLRVAALAMVHRLLFDSGDHSMLSTAAVIGPLCALAESQSRSLTGFQVHCDVEDHPISIDTAIPLTLWIVEAADVLAARGNLDGNGLITISMHSAQRGYTLAVEGSGLGPPVEQDRLAVRLLGSMSRQLGGRLEQVELSASAAVVSINLPAAPYAEGNKAPVLRFELDSI